MNFIAWIINLLHKYLSKDEYLSFRKINMSVQKSLVIVQNKYDSQWLDTVLFKWPSTIIVRVRNSLPQSDFICIKDIQDIMDNLCS